MKKHYPDSEYLCALASRAGEIIRVNFSLGMKKEWKEDGTPLTVTDKTIDNMVTESIRKDFPCVQIASEEGEQLFDPKSEFVLICDPVDGTIPFSHGIPISTFCVSVLNNMRPVVAVICDPFFNRTWHATRGLGSFLGKNKISVSDKKDLKGALIAAHFYPSHFPKAHKIFEDLGALWIQCASAAYFGGLVASGEVVASIFTGKQIWETPAMQLIVEEAGGKATDPFGNELDYSKGKINGHLISNGFLHEKLLEILK